MEAAAASAITAAAMLSPTSSALTRRAAEAAAARGPPLGGAGIAGRLTGPPVLVGGRAIPTPLLTGAPGAAVGGRGGPGAADTVPAPAAGGAAGPPAGSVGSLIVGDEDGLGGRLIRTVSFLGWTLAASGGLGGTEGPGGGGFGSDI